LKEYISHTQSVHSTAHSNKVQDLQGMMIRYAERVGKSGYDGEEWKSEFKEILKMEKILEEDYGLCLTKGEMMRCNELYRKYRC
jgi:hypothetical protein